MGRLRQEPVWAMIGGKMRERQPMYATGPRPDLAKELGFIGAKIPLPYGPAQGEQGLRENVALARKWREACGEDFMLAFDCFMALDTRYTLRLIEALEPLRFHWIEECLPPDDYRGYAELVRQRSHSVMISTGEHEYTRWGFEQLLETGVDIVQPDAWCGGLTASIAGSRTLDSSWVARLVRPVTLGRSYSRNGSPSIRTFALSLRPGE